MDLESVILLDVLGEGRQDGDDGRRAVCATPTGISTVNGVAARKAMRRTSSE